MNYAVQLFVQTELIACVHYDKFARYFYCLCVFLLSLSYITLIVGECLYACISNLKISVCISVHCLCILIPSLFLSFSYLNLISFITHSPPLPSLFPLHLLFPSLPFHLPLPLPLHYPLSYVPSPPYYPFPFPSPLSSTPLLFLVPFLSLSVYYYHF